MSTVAVIRATARASDFLYRRLPSVYAALYDAYKRMAERDAIALIRRLVKPGDRVVDVGANIGFYTELLARRVGPDGRVFAFEPAPANYQQLVQRLRSYSHVEAVRAAVTAESGPTTLYLSPELNIDHRTYRTDEPRQVQTVDGLALDQFFHRADDRVEFVKLDIQGAEYRALLGMRELLARSPEVRLLMELWPFVHDRFGAGTTTLLELLTSWGFLIWRVGRHGRVEARLSPHGPMPERSDPNAYFDVLCTRKEPA